MRRFLSFICCALVAIALTVGVLTVPAHSAPIDGNTSTASSLDTSTPTAVSDAEKAAAKKKAAKS